jgi:hypothetical protein
MHRLLTALVVMVALGVASGAEAACGGSSPTWTAAGLTKTDFDDCNTAATNGDTVNFPAGSATWTSAVTITKRLNLVGAGAGESVITFGTGIGSVAFALGVTDSSVSGFTFQSNQVTDQFISARGDGGTGRIHHNEFINTAASNRRCVYFAGGTGIPHPVYLVDHNTFSNCRVSVVADVGPEFGEREWVADRPWGTNPPAHVIYVESNTFTYSAALGNMAEIDYGGMVVVRFNTIVNTRAELHGTGAAADRAGRWMEVYENDFSGTLIEDGIWYRGGGGVSFSNTFSADRSSPILFDVSTDRSASVGMPDGTKTQDGNLGSGTTYPAAGWPALDQPGYGKYLAAFDGTNYPGMTPEPIAVFLNRRSGTQVPITFANSGEKWIANCFEVQDENTDFASESGACGTGVGLRASRPASCTAGTYWWATDQGGNWKLSNFDGSDNVDANDGTLDKCTATNTWTNAFYTPYTFPHPLAVEEEEPPPPAPSTGKTRLRLRGEAQQ